MTDAEEKQYAEYEKWRAARKQENGEQQASHNPRLIDGDVFLFDQPSQIEIRWGDDDSLLWAAGESLMIVGPSGVGKTTLTGQLLEALIGLKDEVLGRKVYPANKVLYLAMDRPRQVRRAFRRLFTPEQRQLVHDRIVFHNGPLMQQLAIDPMHLMNLAQLKGADVLVVDSLKDIARDINDAKTGSDINTAFQHCLAQGIDVLILHHLRKPTDSKAKAPATINDIFGSQLITAGLGSAILLWGKAGDETVELIHLKPIQERVGPWTVEHDHFTGRSKVTKQFNLLQFVRGRKKLGTNVVTAAREQYGATIKGGDTHYKRTERELKRLLDAGLVTTESPDGSYSSERKYYIVDPIDSMIPVMTRPMTRTDVPIDDTADDSE